METSQRRPPSQDTERNHHPNTPSIAAADDGDNADWYWQCHLCAQISPLPRLYRDFHSVPMTVSQPCTNKDVPCPEPTYSPIPGADEEDRSLERRMRNIRGLRAALAAYAGDGGRVDGGEGAGSVIWYGYAFAEGQSAQGGLETQGSRAEESDSQEGGATTPSTPSSAPSPAPGPGGVNYASHPLSYAFATAENSRTGPGTPVRPRRDHGGAPITTTGARARPSLGDAIPLQVAPSWVSSSLPGSATTTAVPIFPIFPAFLAAFPAIPTVPAVPRDIPRDPPRFDWDGVRAAGGAVNGLGPSMTAIADYWTGECPHRRCEGCYDLDSEMRVVRFCGGSEVHAGRYALWLRGFVMSGDEVEPLVVDGGSEGLSGRQRRMGEGEVMALRGGGLEGGSGDSEDEGVEKRAKEESEEGGKGSGEGEKRGEGKGKGKDKGKGRETEPEPEPSRGRQNSPVRYAAGESRILLVQNTTGSDENDPENRGAAKASSDDGSGFLGDSGSDDDSHSWIEEVTYYHDSQPGSENGSGSGSKGKSDIDEGAEGDDEKEDDDEKHDEDEEDERGRPRANSDTVGLGAFDRRQFFEN